MTTYVGFVIADSMFPERAVILKYPLTLENVRNRIEYGVVSCVNPSHAATISVLKEIGLEIPIPEKPPIVALSEDDFIIVCSVRGLPRLTDRHEYTREEIESAIFAFSEYRYTNRVVLPQPKTGWYRRENEENP